ncbi:MAG: acyltransferase [Vicinamibacterales bacterium]
MIRGVLDKIRRQEPGIYRQIYRWAKRVKSIQVPAIRPLGAVLLHGRDAVKAVWTLLVDRLVYEQMLRYRCDVRGRVSLDGSMPLVYGDGSIVVHDNVHIGNRNTWIVGLKVFPNARLEIGAGTILGYLNVFSVAQSITIGRHCLFAGEIKVIDNNSHSLDFEKRRANAPLHASEVAPIVIDDDVWIGTNCIILKGVTIGRGAVVAAGSVVTRDVPPFTVVAGNPARVVKHIDAAAARDGHVPPREMSL